MTRVAAVDCGTNSIRLLVADIDPDSGELTDLDRRMTIVRLGQGVDRTGLLAPEALARTFDACQEYAAALRDWRVPPERLRFVATSATRDAGNREDFVSGVRDILKVEPEVITGDQEAELSFTGATRELAGDPAFSGPYLVVDIGGGSTELVLGDRAVIAARSVDVGCVRMTERHLLRQPGPDSPDGTPELLDPPPPDRVAAITADIDRALDQAARTVPLERAATLVGLAGSVTTVAGIDLGLDAYDHQAIHHSRVTLERVREISDHLLASTHEQRAAIPVMHPGRVDVIASGALVLRRLMERLNLPEVVVSEHDILDGIAHSCASHDQGP
ncbi:Ppx/GppA phosphatase family protein [Streptomyces sp. NPDC005438]|uniref:Ppx/GppA phosphatase family protein n=1 Tax=Streptomyces sp. NPDC005438 TaxID=3156880 RepID=UPI0033B51906